MALSFCPLLVVHKEWLTDVIPFFLSLSFFASRERWTVGELLCFPAGVLCSFETAHRKCQALASFPLPPPHDTFAFVISSDFNLLHSDPVQPATTLSNHIRSATWTCSGFTHGAEAVCREEEGTAVAQRAEQHSAKRHHSAFCILGGGEQERTVTALMVVEIYI